MKPFPRYVSAFATGALIGAILAGGLWVARVVGASIDLGTPWLLWTALPGVGGLGCVAGAWWFPKPQPGKHAWLTRSIEWLVKRLPAEFRPSALFLLVGVFLCTLCMRFPAWVFVTVVVLVVAAAVLTLGLMLWLKLWDSRRLKVPRPHEFSLNVGMNDSEWFQLLRTAISRLGDVWGSGRWIAATDLYTTLRYSFMIRDGNDPAAAPQPLPLNPQVSERHTKFSVCGWEGRREVNVVAREAGFAREVVEEVIRFRNRRRTN